MFFLGIGMPKAQAAPSAPSLSSPSDGATDVSTTPKFDWSSVSGATSYQLQVSKSSDFSSTVLDTGWVIDDWYQVIDSLSQATEYYWRVRAKDLLGNAGSWSSTWSFSTTEGLAISNVEITDLSSTSATVSWSTNVDSTGSISWGPTRDLAKVPIPTDLSAKSHSVELTPLLPDTTYYFKVSATRLTQTVTDDNNGSLYKLKTQELEIPSFENLKSEIQKMEVSIEGAAFQLPKALDKITNIEDEIETYTNKISSNIEKVPQDIFPKNLSSKWSEFESKWKEISQLETSPFLLVQEDNFYLVLSEQAKKGQATVEGYKIGKSLNINGVSLSLIVAKDVSFDKEGKSATVNEIVSNPDKYEMELVKINAQRRQVSLSVKYSKKIEIKGHSKEIRVNTPMTVGYLVNEPSKASNVVSSALRDGRQLIENPTKNQIKNMFNLNKERLGVFDFERDYWIDSPAVTNGIVLTDGPILDKLQKVLRTFKDKAPELSEFIQLDDSIPVLYDVNSKLDYQNVSSPSKIIQNPEEYQNKVVGLEATEFGMGISIKEVLEKTPIGAQPFDIGLEATVNWSGSLPQNPREEILISIGGSSKSCSLHSPIKGKFKVIGRVVNTSQIDESLGDHPVLLVYGKENLGGIDWMGIAEDAKSIIENEISKLSWSLSSSFPEVRNLIKTDSIPQPKPPEQVIVMDNPEDLPEKISVKKKAETFLKSASSESPIDLNLENSAVSRIKIEVSEKVENVSVSFEKTDNPTVPAPGENISEKVYSYMEIDSGIDESSIEKSTVEFKVSKGWIEEQNVENTNVRLLKYSNGKWKKLTTEIIGSTATHTLYSAETTGFSSFAITTFTEEKEPSEEEKGGGVPIFAIIGIIIGITIVSGAAYYKSKK